MATLIVKDFPDDIYERIEADAQRERRSIAQQVIYLLEQATRAGSVRSILELRGLGKEAWRDIDAAEHVQRERDAWD